MRDKIKNLWKLCFNDSEEFTELYFSRRFSNEANLFLQSGEEVIAALQALPYPMTFGGKEVRTAYLSGVCTHPDYRGRGVMRELLSQALARMHREGVLLSTLIPAEPELFRYYAASGYAPVFGCSRALFTASEGSITDQTVTPERSDKYSEDIYRYLNRKLRERPYCVQHTEEDFKVVLADLRLSRGTVYTLRQDRKIVALAVAVPEEEGARVEEAVAETPALRRLLLQHICEDLRLPALRTTAPPEEGIPATPLGMARIINAHAFLQRYAALHPALEMNILLSDPQLSANNGYYYLTGGKCLYCDTRLPGKHLTLDIGGLAGELLSPLRPYMSLMMN